MSRPLRIEFAGALYHVTPENYFAHVSKDKILEVVGEAVSPDIAQTLTKMKKGALVESAEK